MDARIVVADDEDVTTRVITLAFAHDPVWYPALGRADGATDHHFGYWRFFVRGAVPHGLSGIANDGAAVSVWLPGDASEVSDADAVAFDRYLAARLSPSDVDQLQELFQRFEDAHPRTEPHNYLSLLGTHPEHRGRGIGQALLRWDLDRFDADGIPTYLESSNSANDYRYQRVGYRPVSSFRAVRDGTVVTGMWRPVGG